MTGYIPNAEILLPPERFYTQAQVDTYIFEIATKDAEIAQLRSEVERLKARNTELEAFAKKWGTDASLSERRTLHEASVAYRKAAGIFPNPDGVKAILDK